MLSARMQARTLGATIPMAKPSLTLRLLRDSEFLDKEGTLDRRTAVVLAEGLDPYGSFVVALRRRR